MKKFTYEELAAMNCKSLRDVAKGLDVSGRWDMNKDTLIACIMDVQEKFVCVDCDEEKKEEPEVKEENQKVVCESSDTPKNSNLEEMEKRVNRASVGTLVAFFDILGKARTGKITEHTGSGIIAETEYGAKFLVTFDKVLWVKFNHRWPRWVYNLLKGIKVNCNA